MRVIIKDLESVLTPTCCYSGKEIFRADIKYLTAPGENYGSVLLSVVLTVKETLNGEDKTLFCVAKTVPKNDFIKNFFMSSLTFKKELGFYDTIIPTLKEFQIDEGIPNVINFTAAFLGGRLSLNSTLDQADEDAIILLENLRIQKYTIVDRMIGFDFDTACLIIKDLAVLHALPIALKIKRPDVFKAKILPFLEFANVFQSVGEDMRKDSIEDILNVAKENPKYVPYLEKIRKKCEKCYAILDGPKSAREPFATFIHNDLWTNNTMIRFNENGKPIHNKIIDFQFTTYDSPGIDLIFLIFDSVQSEVVKNHYDEFINLYYDTFISVLKGSKIETKEFTFEKFTEELDYAAANTFCICQCFTMLRPIFALKEVVNEVEKLSSQNILQFKEPSKQHKEKLYFLIEEFAERKWI